MKPYCDICNGSRRIRVPTRAPFVAMAFDSSAPQTSTSREYPCPECNDLVSPERLSIRQISDTYDGTYFKNQDFLAHAKMTLAINLAGYLLENELIRFDTGQISGDAGTFPIQATIGVVSPAYVATLEQRIGVRQDEVARDVVKEAERKINNWGSASICGREKVDKTDAIMLLHDAFKTAMDKKYVPVAQSDRAPDF